MRNSEINIRDPFVLVHGGQYYMYGTRACSFGIKTAGFDVYTGTDLENWSEPKQVFCSDDYGMNRGANWAPEVHEIDGQFYMFASFTRKNGLRGTFILKSDKPDGQFAPVSENAATPENWECIDGTFFRQDRQNYIVFCHEHTQAVNGTICFLPLNSDFTRRDCEPTLMFDADSFLCRVSTDENHGVTDGPFLYRHSNGSLLLLWSTSRGGYCQCLAVSENGRLDGEWHHLPCLFENDGGHGMLFRDFAGKLRLVLHQPNSSLNERPRFFAVEETENSLRSV